MRLRAKGRTRGFSRACCNIIEIVYVPARRVPYSTDRENLHGRWSMSTVRILAVIAVGFGLASCLSTVAALARPPTAIFSPGYEARLAESRQKLWASQYYWQNYRLSTQPRPVHRLKKSPRSRPVR